MVFVGATRYRVSTDFLIALLGACALEWALRGGAGQREGPARPPDRRHRRLRASPSDAPACSGGARSRRAASSGSTTRRARPILSTRRSPCRSSACPAPRDLDPRLALRVRRATRSADLVHTHLVHADVYGALGARRLVSTKHNDDPFRAGAFRFVERGTRPQASAGDRDHATPSRGSRWSASACPRTRWR